MLQVFKQLQENPQDIPQIPKGVAEYLQTILNAGHLLQTRTIARLKSEGYSEEFLIGFLSGCQYACEQIDAAEAMRDMYEEDLNTGG